MTRPIDNFATLVSECAAWQSLTGAVDAAGALVFIKRMGLESAAYPRMYTRYGSIGSDKVDVNTFKKRGVIAFRVEMQTAEATLEGQFGAVMEFGEALMEELQARSIATGLLEIAAVDIVGATKSGRLDQVKYWELKGEVRFP